VPYLRKLAVVVTDAGKIKTYRMPDWQPYTRKDGERFMGYVRIPQEIDYGPCTEATLLEYHLRHGFAKKW